MTESKAGETIAVVDGLYEGDWIDYAVTIKDKNGATHRFLVDKQMRTAFAIECVVKIKRGKATVTIED